MKQFLLVAVSVCTMLSLQAQTYPEPEFSNEVYYLKKDSAHSLVRLEKENSKMETKSKGIGFGGYENGYMLDGEKSSVRLNNGNGLSFVFSTGGAGKTTSQQTDSIMRANGMDPSMMSGMGGTGDPANTITLYKTETGKGKRKIFLQKTGGAFSGGKLQSSDKYTFSVKRIRDGYWELVIDKTLPKGEYAFTTMSYAGMNSMDGSATLFTFGID
jgi:hypothetical protein